MGYTSSKRKHGMKVLTKANKRRIISIVSHVNSNLSNDLKSSNIDSVKINTTCDYSTLVPSGTACPSCGFCCIRGCFRPTFTVYFQNGLLSPKILIGAVLFKLFSHLFIIKFVFIPNLSYKVIQR